MVKKQAIKKQILICTILMAMGISGCGQSSNETDNKEMPVSQEKNVEVKGDELENANQEATVQENTGLESEKQEDANVSNGFSFTDDLGEIITVGKVEKAAALSGSFADIWTLAGGNVIASTKDAWNYPGLDMPEDAVNLGSIMDINMEQLLLAKPDLILASKNLKAQVQWKDTFKEAGIPSAYFDINNFNDYLKMLNICTQITGEKDRYDTYGTKVKEEVDHALQRAEEYKGEAPTILYLRASSDNVTAKGSEGNVGSQILKELGCVNIADVDESLLDNLSMEAIIAADPEYIFVTTQGEDTEKAMMMVDELFTQNPAWNSLFAVKNGKYYVLSKDLYNSKPNEKWGEAYNQLADILFGEE